MKQKFFYCFLLTAWMWGACQAPSGKEDADHPAYQNPVVAPYTKALATNPDEPELYYRRSEALMRVNEPELAEKDLRVAVAGDSLNLRYRQTLGWVLLRQGKGEEAIAVFGRCLQLQPGSIPVRMLLAEACLVNQELHRATEELNKILRADSAYPGALPLLARVSAAQGDTQSAITHLQQALDVRPDDYAAVVQLGELWSAVHDDRALSMFHRAFALDTTDVRPLVAIGIFHEQAQRNELAKAMYRSCILRDPNSTTALLHYGTLLLQEDSTQKALRQFRLAIRTQPNSAPAFLMKGKAFEKLHLTDSAKAAYRQALVFRPELSEAQEALARLAGR